MGRAGRFLNAALAHSTSITLRRATHDDAEFLFSLLRAALGPYVEETYGPWDEADQRARFFAANPTETHEIVEADGRPIGCLDVRRLDDQLKLNRVFLLPEFQRRGIGSRLLADVLTEADTAGLPVRLRVFQVNPARNLYTRLGFRVTEETATHLVMERAAPGR